MRFAGYSNRTRDPDRRRRRCFHANFPTPGLTKWCRRKQGVSCTRCCSYFSDFLRCGYNHRDPAAADPSQHGARDGKQKMHQSAGRGQAETPTEKHKTCNHQTTGAQHCPWGSFPTYSNPRRRPFRQFFVNVASEPRSRAGARRNEIRESGFLWVTDTRTGTTDPLWVQPSF